MWLRLIIIFLAVWLIIRILKKIRSPRRAGRSTPVAAMVRCEYCSLFLPESEAVNSGGHYYCCEEHKSLAHK